MQQNIFAKRLKKLIKKHSITQNELGNIVGASRQSISLYVNGERTPDIEIAARLADYFHTSVDYLLGLTELKSPNEDDKQVYFHTGLTDGALITIQQAKNEQEEYDLPTLDALNELLSNDDFAAIIEDFACIKSLPKPLELSDDEFLSFENQKLRLELSLIRRFEKLRRSMIEQLRGIDYD